MPPPEATWTGPRPLSCALAIGGLDPGGGAGILADLRAFAAAGVFGCAAAAVLTVQSTAGLRRVHAVPAGELTAQVLEVLAHQRVRAMKVGALGSAENVRAVGKILGRYPRVPAVVDTPMRPTRGKGHLLSLGAITALRKHLIPRAALLTVNADEASSLLGAPVHDLTQARAAARALVAEGARAVLVKGGHLPGPRAIDVLAVGREVIELRARRIDHPALHGTGCTLASLIAGRIASGRHGSGTPALREAVRWAKRAHHAALARAADVGGGARVLAFA
jgi:hydroxymethylpyrimidine/phosphomethylpyrimidine kinase